MLFIAVFFSSRLFFSLFPSALADGLFYAVFPGFSHIYFGLWLKISVFAPCFSLAIK
jgi:hypothetical protein